MEESQQTKKHILFVESNEDDALLLRRAIREIPHCTSFLCRSVAEARAYLSRTGIYSEELKYPAPDALITEIRLGVDSGYELLIWIRENKKLRDLPLYVLAGEYSPVDESNLASLRVRRFIRKPRDPAELKITLESLVDEVCSSGTNGAR